MNKENKVIKTILNKKTQENKFLKRKKVVKILNFYSVFQFIFERIKKNKSILVNRLHPENKNLKEDK